MTCPSVMAMGIGLWLGRAVDFLLLSLVLKPRLPLLGMRDFVSSTLARPPL